MTVEVASFRNEGHRLLLASKYAPSEIARLTGLPRPRISEWRAGSSTPKQEARIALEKVGIPQRTWEMPPLEMPREEPAPTTSAAPPVPIAPLQIPESDAEIDALGVEGIRQVIARLRTMAPGLPPRERVAAAVAEGRLHDRLVAIEKRDADARAEYLASPEFQGDAKLLTLAVPDSAELRVRLARLGAKLPDAPSSAQSTELPPPKTVRDVEELCRELEAAREFRNVSEEGLAKAHVLGLALDVHADAIASIIAGDAPLTARLLGLLDGADAQVIGAALERRIALRDVLGLAPDVRAKVAELIRRLGHADVASEIEIGGGK